MRKTPKFVEYEKVIVNSNDPDYLEFNNEIGVICGQPYFHDNCWHYGVFIESVGEEMLMQEHDVISTGQVGKREDYYDDNVVIKVSVDEDGKGYLK